MKAICIIIAVVVALSLLVLFVYVWLKLRGWNITFDACVRTDAEEPINKRPRARDASCRFIKQQ